MKKCPSLSRIIAKLVDDAEGFSFLHPGRKNKVGETILKLKDEEREVLKTAKASDFGQIPKYLGKHYEQTRGR